MSNHKNLTFFNKEGHNLNYKYNESSKRFEGDILFHENSTDTFKSYSIYTLEKINSFEFEAPNVLSVNKFQLFNEYGIHFYGSTYKTQTIKKIEPVNNDPNFNSKWIYGDKFDKKFKIGTLIRFDSSFLEFTNSNIVYTILATKKNAIMILSSLNNKTFEEQYYELYDNPDFYTNLSISGVNTIGIYDYIDFDYNNNLSTWSEPNFYDKLYKRKKLNVINTTSNDDVYTVTNENLIDLVHYEYTLGNYQLTNNSNLLIEVILKGDLPKIYEGSILIESNRLYLVDNTSWVNVLRSGKEFKIIGSELNNNFMRVIDVVDFNNINNMIEFSIYDQVIYDSIIYECINAYTHDNSVNSESYITPINTNYWKVTNHIKVETTLNSENIINGQIYLTNDRYYYNTEAQVDSKSTLLTAIERYKNEFLLYGVDLYYKDNFLKADPKWNGDYVQVNFYNSLNTQIGQFRLTNERLIEVSENLITEMNYDISENIKYNIVFTDLDEFGIKINIDKQIYEIDTNFIYSGSNVDVERTIDQTLKNWLTTNYYGLYKLGVNVELGYSGNIYSNFYNTITLTTDYPNVPMNIKYVRVGTTGDFYIEDSRVIFNELSKYLNIRINDRDYSISILENEQTDVVLEKWIELYADILLEFDIRVSSVSNMLLFRTNNTDTRLVYSIHNGKLNLPGAEDYQIIDDKKGNLGVLITSNELILENDNSISFEENGFATGMILSLNNTIRPLMNIEYNIQFLDPSVLNLSYEGPFWDLGGDKCDSSPFVTLSFDSGYGMTGCDLSLIEGDGGPYDEIMYDALGFSLKYNPNTYTNVLYDVQVQNAVDILYVDLVDSFYILGDNISVFGTTNNYKTTIGLTATNSLKMVYNSINNLIYSISDSKLYRIDPVTNKLFDTYVLPSTPNDILINTKNGDVYITLTGGFVYVLDRYNTIKSNLLVSSVPYTIEYNQFENDVYITLDDNSIVRIDCNSYLIVNQFTSLSGLNLSFLKYEPVKESIYYQTNSGLYKIDNGLVEYVNSNTYSIISAIYNNSSNEINISDISGAFTRINYDNVISSTDIAFGGKMVLNLYDNDVYISSENMIMVVDSNNGGVLKTIPTSVVNGNLIYNHLRKSVIILQPETSQFIEVKVELNIEINELDVNSVNIEDNGYGTLDSNYTKKDNIWLKTREYYRQPRENFTNEVSVKYYWRWYSDNVSEFFLYDYSGDQLPIEYSGVKPLDKIVLNDKANTDVNKWHLPEYQQTVFEKITHVLNYIDDEEDISTDVEPLQLNIGFQSNDEGALRSILQLYKSEDIKFDIITNAIDVITFTTIESDVDRYGLVKINPDSELYFTNRGLKKGQQIGIYLKDNTNTKNQLIPINNAKSYIIREVYSNTIVLDFINDTDYMYDETTHYIHNGVDTFLKMTIRVLDLEIGRFMTYGQTEEEDIRFKIELGNVGKLIAPNEVFIFKDYDIQEGGIDWLFLNKKRKEMLMMKDVIYPYIGSYKSIINAINFFGYNDLQLNEYYKNVDSNSVNFGKLFKVEIPDIFDNSVSGWNDSDFIKGTYATDNFETTNLFNLTYDITDKEGNNVLNYTVDEVIIKLQGLKYFLKRNIIPLTHKILDITGKFYLNNSIYIQHKMQDIQIVKMKEEMTPITFKMNEIYLIPINSGSTVYNCVLDFYSIINSYDSNIRPYNGSVLVKPDTYSIKIRTYKTYREWNPFEVYKFGDKVVYYDKLWQSIDVEEQKLNNPVLYADVAEWIAGFAYSTTNIVKYKGLVYSLIKDLLETELNISPDLLSDNWNNITTWVEINMKPVQTIKELRSGDDLLPFNFTIDSNIDPFIKIEVVSDNGYGLIYTDMKNYEVRGNKDLINQSIVREILLPYKEIKDI